MTDARPDFIRGTLEMLVLKVLDLGPMHGWGISERIQSLSQDALSFSQGSLYPVLARLQREGMITASWARTENNRRAKYYRLTPEGAARLTAEHANWRRLRSAVDWIMETAS
jgi:PadR family transcriptional regulator PadR